MSYDAKSDLVRNRQLKVQELNIPFKIVGNATPASVAITKDEPSVLFLKSQGVDQITPALDAADGTPSLTAANDANGIFNLMVKVGESLSKIQSARIVSRIDGVSHPCFIDDTDGISAAGDKILLTCDSTVALNAANTLDACLEVKYVVSE